MIFKYISYLPYYKFSENGEVYRFRFWKSKLIEKDIFDIKQLSKFDSQRNIAKIFNITKTTVRRIIICDENKIWAKMKPSIDDKNNQRLTLLMNNKKFTFLVARLICEAFHGPCPESMECCHNDGDTSNNHYVNLRWDTRQANIKDRIKHGVHVQGIVVGTSKLLDDDIINIRKEYKNGFSQNFLADKYKISQGEISGIVNFKKWKHIE